jgi:hypothetical protein
MSVEVNVDEAGSGDGVDSGGGQVEAGVSERLEHHGAEIARIEAELRAEIERLRTDLSQALMNASAGTAEHSHAEIAALEERIAAHERELDDLAETVETEVVEEPPPAEEPPAAEERPPEREHFLHRKLF